MLPGRLSLRRDILLASNRKLLIEKQGDPYFLVGASRPVRDDLPPMIILDASVKLRNDYRLMEAARIKLIRVCGATDAYLIVSPRTNLTKLFPSNLPGTSIIDWLPLLRLLGARFMHWISSCASGSRIAR